MREASLNAAIPANNRGAASYNDSAVTCTISEIFRSKYPNKTWAFLASCIGLQERAAKHRLSATRPYTVSELRTLLRSEDGLEFLEALMEGAEPKWWWWGKQVMTVASIKRRRAEDEQEILKLETSAPAETGARRRIKGALDANRRVNSAVDRTETALGFLAPNADRAVARAVAPAKAVPAKRAYAGRGR